MKGRISERAKPCYNNSVWVSHTYFDVPQAAFLKEVPTFPYIRADFASFDVIEQLEMEARDFWVLIQAAAVGNPLVIGCWFEYADRELEFAEWENTLRWILPEIPPHVARCTRADLNVPPAFVIPSSLCAPVNSGADSALHALDQGLRNGIAYLEKVTGRRFGDGRQPLLVSVRSGAERSMPGMLQTILDVGLNHEMVHGLIRLTGNPRLAGIVSAVSSKTIQKSSVKRHCLNWISDSRT